MRTRAEAKSLAIGRRSRGRAAARERDGADRWGISVSVLREGEGAGARSVDAGRVGMGRPAAQFPGHPLCSSFSFSFCAVYDICLNLCSKFCANPKNFENFCMASLK